MTTREEVTNLEALRAVVDEDLGALAEEREQLEAMVAQIEARRARIERQWKRLIAERDRVDERLWRALCRPVKVQRQAPLYVVGGAAVEHMSP